MNENSEMVLVPIAELNDIRHSILLMVGFQHCSVNMFVWLACSLGFHNWFPIGYAVARCKNCLKLRRYYYG